MSLFGLGGVEFLILTLFYSGVGLPLGVPPAEQDPLMLRVAPEQCLYYTTWAGMAAPNADAGNPTEALMAEPEVRKFVEHLDTALQAGFAQLGERGGGGTMGPFFAEAGPLWIKTLITSPTAIYVTKFDMHPDGAPEIQGGAIVNTGDATVGIRDSMLAWQKLLRDEVEIAEVEIDGATFYRCRPEEDAPLLTWGVRGKYLVLGLGDDSIESMFANARTAPPKWLTDLQASSPVERQSTMTYADLPTLIQSGLNGLNAKDREQAGHVIAALGLNGITSYSSVTGLEKDGFVNRTSLSIDGKSRGLLALADAKPLAADDIAPVPADSTIAFSLRLDGQQVFDLVQEIAREVDPQLAAKVDEGVGAINQMLGLDLREEILAGLGDTWSVYNSAGEGGLLFTGLTATIDVRDPKKMAKVHKQLMALAEAALQPREEDEFAYRSTPILKKFEFQGRAIHYLTGIEDMPLAPAWCLTDTHLVVALFPQSIEAFLARDAQYKSLATNSEVAKQLAQTPGPLSLTYVDTKTLFEILYPVAKIAAAGALNNLAEETGVDIDVSVLPRAETIGRHLRPSVTAVTRSQQGIEFTSRQSLPGSSMGSSTPIAVALLLPAVQAARTAARRMQSLNNLKQIALAMHNHAATFRNFPPASIKTEDGKPGLSWRVKILPFIEEQALYDQFRLDEPWDSEHNRKLLEKMPVAYRSPASAAAPGLTTYLGVAGEDGIFSNNEKGTSMAEIRDGLSNTLMVVEVNDRAAVPWTKPDDFHPADGMKPMEKLEGVWPGVFQAAMGDGSVHALSTNINPKTLKALFTKSGAEVVGWDEIHGEDRHDAREAPLEADAPREETAPEEAFEAVP